MTRIENSSIAISWMLLALMGACDSDSGAVGSYPKMVALDFVRDLPARSDAAALFHAKDVEIIELFPTRGVPGAVPHSCDNAWDAVDGDWAMPKPEMKIWANGSPPGYGGIIDIHYRGIDSSGSAVHRKATVRFEIHGEWSVDLLRMESDEMSFAAELEKWCWIVLLGSGILIGGVFLCLLAGGGSDWVSSIYVWLTLAIPCLPAAVVGTARGTSAAFGGSILAGALGLVALYFVVGIAFRAMGRALKS